MQKKIGLNLICLISISFILSCSKKEDTIINNSKKDTVIKRDSTQIGNVTKIKSIDINKGAYNTQVTIIGNNFGINSSDSKVYFNGKQATVISKSDTAISALVPLGAGTGNISLIINNKTITGPIFTYEYSYVLSILAGNGSQGITNGNGTSASFNGPEALVIDANENIFIADTYNNVIRKITFDGTVSIFSGSGEPKSEDGTGAAASFNKPDGLAIDAAGNLYVSEYSGEKIRKITPNGIVSTIAGTGKIGSVDDNGNKAMFNGPCAMTIDKYGNLLICDSGNKSIRKIASDGTVTTLTEFKELKLPSGIATDKTGGIYICDRLSGKIYKSDGINVNVIYSTSNNTPSNNPVGITIDNNDNIYILNSVNQVSKIVRGSLTPILSQKSFKSILNSLRPNATTLTLPSGITINKNGVFYIADANANLIREISLQ